MERAIKPYEQVRAMLGDACTAWEKLLGHIRFFYAMDELWKEGNPTHKNYNNLYIQRGGKTLAILSLREGFFVACIVFGKDEREEFGTQRALFGEAVCTVFDETDTYHDGTWLAFDIRDESLVDDIIRLLHIKRKPNRKVLPESLEKIGRAHV
jgi:hypothetical protein